MPFSEAYDPFRALAAIWKLLKRAPLTLLVGGVLMTLTEGGCHGGGQFATGDRHHSAEEVLLILAVLFVLFLVGIGFWLFNCLIRVGFARAVEGSLRTGEEHLPEVFKSRGRWAWMVLTTLIQGLLGFAMLVPGFIAALLGVLVGALVESEALAVLLAIAGFLAWLPVFFYLYLGISLMPEAVALEDRNAFEALERSWSLVRGNRLRLFIYYVVTGFASLLGLLACCVGVLFTGALVNAAYYESYLRLVRSPEEQAGWVQG